MLPYAHGPLSARHTHWSFAPRWHGLRARVAAKNKISKSNAKYF